jgi:hypothetical protein
MVLHAHLGARASAWSLTCAFTLLFIDVVGLSMHNAAHRALAPEVVASRPYSDRAVPMPTSSAAYAMSAVARRSPEMR